MNKRIYAVINEGCQECGVESLPVAYFDTQTEADAAAAHINAEQKGWRDGGQAGAIVHPLDHGIWPDDAEATR